MFKNKYINGRNNRCGETIARLRQAENKSQKELANALQDFYFEIDKNAIQKIECGKRFVTDIELAVFAEYFGVTTDFLISNPDNSK